MPADAHPGAAPAPAAGRFAHFDGLRAIAALSVFGLHGVYQIAIVRPQDHGWYRWAVHLDVGVTIFFVISGFLLFRPLLAGALAGRPTGVRAYAWRRAVRIVPAYWVALAIITVWFDLTEVQSLGGALRFGLFAQVYDASDALRGMGQAWSLDVEVLFYAVLPVVALVPLRTRSLRASLVAVLAFAAAGLAWRLFAVTQVDVAAPGSASWLYVLPAHMDALGAGMLLATAWVAREQGHRLRAVGALARHPGRCWAAAIALFIVLGLIVDGGTRANPLITDPQYVVARTLYAVIALLIVLPAVFTVPAGTRSPVHGLLASRPMQLMGLVSYSFYLWHYAAIGQLLRWWGRPPAGVAEWIAWVAACLAAGIALAALSFVLIERPFMRLGRLVQARRGQAQLDAAQLQAAP